MESMAWKGKGRAQGEPWAQEAFCKEESFDPLAEFQERGYLFNHASARTKRGEAATGDGRRETSVHGVRE